MPLGVSSDVSWKPFGGLLGRLGASWEPLGASWASLGRLLAPLKAMSEKLLVFPAYARARARSHRRKTCLGCERKAALEVNRYMLRRFLRFIFDLRLFVLTQYATNKKTNIVDVSSFFFLPFLLFSCPLLCLVCVLYEFPWCLFIHCTESKQVWRWQLLCSSSLLCPLGPL